MRLLPWRTLPIDVRAEVKRYRRDLVVLLREPGSGVRAPEPPTPPSPPTVPTTPTLSPADYHRFGISVVRGIPTHPLGDQYAADVIAGRIPRQHAEQAEQAADRMALGLMRAARRR